MFGHLLSKHPYPDIKVKLKRDVGIILDRKPWGTHFPRRLLPRCIFRHFECSSGHLGRGWLLPCLDNLQKTKVWPTFWLADRDMIPISVVLYHIIMSNMVLQNMSKHYMNFATNASPVSKSFNQMINVATTYIVSFGSSAALCGRRLNALVVPSWISQSQMQREPRSSLMNSSAISVAAASIVFHNVMPT